MQSLGSIQRGNPATDLVEMGLTGENEARQLTFHINRDRLARAQALDGRYALATNAAHLEANTALTIFKKWLAC
ncbi:MAG: hypothetical protein JXR84_22120 [Anaerolineae bacterium]|nr:hypothetical protein [Anaerolineae bacterium]